MSLTRFFQCDCNLADEVSPTLTGLRLFYVSSYGRSRTQ